MTTDAEIFAAIRERKGDGLTQDEVNTINAIMYPKTGATAVVNKAGLDLMKEFEGCKLTAYPDPATGGEPWTIGFGHTGGVKKGDVWTQAKADSVFADDVSKFADGVAKLICAAPTTSNQFSAMVSLAFNIGLGNFKESTLLRMHKDGDYSGAAGQFIRWNRAAGKVMAGLTRRREAEAALYRK